MMKFFVSLIVTGLCCCAIFLHTANAQQTVTPATLSGIKQFQAGDYQRTLTILQKVVVDDKTDYLAWLYSGAAAVHLKDAKVAKKCFDKLNHLEKKKVEFPVGTASDKPLNIKSKPRAFYTEDARRNNVSGQIRLMVEFGSDGTIKFIQPILGLPNGLTDEAVVAAHKMEFESATRDHKPITVVKIVEYNFELY